MPERSWRAGWLGRCCLIGLTGMPASGASLLLNGEGVFTALLAWFVFKENFDQRIALGMLAIVAGAAVLSWPGETRFAGVWPSLAILGACFAWGIDNNLTRKVSLIDATWIAAVKGLVSGTVNLVLAIDRYFSAGAHQHNVADFQFADRYGPFPAGATYQRYLRD